MSEAAKLEDEEKHGTCSGRTEKGEGVEFLRSTLEKRRLDSDFANGDGNGDGTTLLGLVRLRGPGGGVFGSASFPSGMGDCVTAGAEDRVTAGAAIGRFAPEHVLASPAASSEGVTLVLNHGADSAAAAVSRAATSTASRPAD